MQDDPRLEGYNAEERAAQFLIAIGFQAPHYATNHIMLTMGGDFNYENAREYFENLDKLIYHTNKLFVSVCQGYNNAYMCLSYCIYIRVCIYHFFF